MKKRILILGGLLVVCAIFVLANMLSVALMLPDYTNASSSDINFTVSAQSNTSLKNLTIYANFTGSWAANETNSTLFANATPNNITVTGISDGYYVWNAYVCDAENSCIYAGVNLSIKIDTTYPQITFNTSTGATAATGANVSQDWLFLKVNITEINERNVTFFLWNNTGAVNLSNYSAGNYSVNWTNVPNGNYTYYATYRDWAGNVNSTAVNYTITLDTVAPQVTLISPVDDGTDTDGTVNFTYNVTDATTGVLNCSLYMDNVLNTTNTAVTNGSTNNFTIVNAPAYNILKWSVRCYDYAANSNWTANRTVDTYAATTASSSSSSSSGKSGTTISMPTIYSAGVLSSGGYTQALSKGEVIDFTVAGESHNLELNYIIAMHSGGDTNYRAKVTLSSEPVSIFLEEGKSKSVDLDEDGTNDVKVTAKNIDSDSVEITILSLASSSSQGSEAVDSIETTDDSEEAEMPEEETPMAWWIWLILAVLVIVLVLGFVLKHNKK